MTLTQRIVMVLVATDREWGAREMARAFGVTESGAIREFRQAMLACSRIENSALGKYRIAQKGAAAFTTGAMLAAYDSRVLGFINSQNGIGVSPRETAAGLSVSYEVARASLTSLCRRGAVVRTGCGKKGQPFRYRANQ